MRKIMRKKKGFAFVEIMVVVAVLSLLTLISLPLINNMRISANEAKAQANIKTLADVLESYWIANNTYQVTLASLADDTKPGTPPYLDKSWTNGADKGGKSGYLYSIEGVGTTTNKYGYKLMAKPAVAGKTGTRTFTLEHTGEIVVASGIIYGCVSQYVTCWDGSKIMTQACVNNQLVATGNTCPPEDIIAPCQQETTRCPDGTWIITKKCVGEKLIPTDATCPTCTPVYQICGDGSTIEIKDKYCTATGKTCPTCTPQYCPNGSLKIDSNCKTYTCPTCTVEYCGDGRTTKIDSNCKTYTCPACTDVTVWCPLLKKSIVTYKCVNGTLVPFLTCGSSDPVGDALTAPVTVEDELPGGTAK